MREQGQLLSLIVLALDAGMLDSLAVPSLELKLDGGIVDYAQVAQKVFLQVRSPQECSTRRMSCMYKLLAHHRLSSAHPASEAVRCVELVTTSCVQTGQQSAGVPGRVWGCSLESAGGLLCFV